jgi:hypothetical protein
MMAKKTTKKTTKKAPTKAKRQAPRKRTRKDPSELRISMNISVRRDLLDRIDELAEQHEVTRSSFCESVLLDALTVDREQARFMANPTVRDAFFKAFTAPGVIAALAESFKGEIDEDTTQLFMEFMEHQADGFNVARGRKVAEK